MTIPSDPQGLIERFTHLVDRVFERHLMNPGQLTEMLNSDEFAGYILFPTRQELQELRERTDAMSEPPNDPAIELAKKLGTYNKADRSQQYYGRYSNEILKRNDDLLFQKLREMEEREFRHKVILALIALVPSIIMFVMWYFG